MIAKISSTENLGGALGYNFKKVQHDEAAVLCVNELRKGFDGTFQMDKVLADMQKAIPEQCRTKKTVFHCSLNPHPDEKLSDERLTQIAKEYMEELGYGKQPYIVFKHNDIAREHIHIVSLRVDSQGRKINDKYEGRRSKKITNALEKKYNLIPSSKVSDRTTKETPKVDTTQGNIKEQVANTVRSAMKHYTFCSLGELNAVLRKYNLAVEEVKTEYRGKRYDGLVYVPTDDKGNKVSTPIHASDIGRGVGYAAVQNKMLKSKQIVKPLIPTIRRKVLEVMRTSPHTEGILRQRLEEQGLRVVSERMIMDASMVLRSLMTKKALRSMVPDWVKDMLPMYSTHIYLIQHTIHSWMNRFMERLIPPYSNRCRQYSLMSRKATTLSMN